jgi:AraC-like DNA-binding protein
MTGGTEGEISRLLLGVCVGALLAMAAAMLRAPRPTVRWAGFAFFFTSAFFAVKLWCDQTGVLPPEVQLIVGAVAMSSVGWFWLMVMAMFADCDEYRPSVFLAPGLLALFALGHQLPAPFMPFVWTGSTLLQAGFAIAALVVVVRSWKGDLVESRRRVRGPFMVAVALYILSLNGFDIWDMLGDIPDWYPMFNAGMLTLCVLAGSMTFLEARGKMFGKAEAPALPQQPEPAVRAVAPATSMTASTNGHANGHTAPNGNGAGVAIDRAAKADLDRLECLMVKELVWKEEGLTIASLALRAGMPETQLRRLINDCLGYRNFPSYVNAHRISEAKTRLADPNEARVSISTIAYDIGFASLGPFNRAFKEESGVSPSEWRRKALDLPSPIPAQA